MKDGMTFINWLQKPIAVLRIRAIQKEYKKITLGCRSSDEYNRLILLQAKEEYYRKQFDSWGKYHPRFSYDQDQLREHKKYLAKIFPEKDFIEDEIVVWHKYDAVTYYHNKIYTLGKGSSPHYATEIIKQLKRWNK